MVDRSASAEGAELRQDGAVGARLGRGHAPGVGLEDVEPCGIQRIAESIRRPPISGDDRVLEWLHVGADEETDEEPTARSEHTSELIERTMDRVGLVVDQRVPRQDPSVTIGRTLEGVNVPERERHIRVGPSCVLDELRNLIDSSCFTALLPEEGSPMARATTSVSSGPSTDAAHDETRCTSDECTLAIEPSCLTYSAARREYDSSTSSAMTRP